MVGGEAKLTGEGRGKCQRARNIRGWQGAVSEFPRKIREIREAQECAGLSTKDACGRWVPKKRNRRIGGGGKMERRVARKQFQKKKKKKTIDCSGGET